MGATYKLKRKLADGTLEDVVLQGAGSAEPFIVTFTNSGNNNYTVDVTYDDIEQAFSNGKIVIGKDSTNSYIYQIFGLNDDDTIPFSRIVNWGEYGAVVETLFVNTDDSVSYARNTLGGGSSSGGDADTFVVHFDYDGQGNLVADQSFDEIYSKMQDGKMPFAELENTSLLCYHQSSNSIAFRSIEPYVGSGVDGDDSFIDIHYISLGLNGYAGDWWRTIKIPSGSQGSGAGQQSVTYAKLKELRDDGKLVAGMRYRIVDFVTTTSQPDTQSAGHPFNIIVTALSNTTLSENASADLPVTNIANDDGSLVQGSVMPFYYVFEDFTEGSGGTEEGYKATDEFIAYDYLENGDGVVVPVIYKTDAQGAIDSPEEFGEPDYEDIFYYDGTMEIDGVTYDKWRKICETQEFGPFWDGRTGYIWALTNVIVKDGQIGGGAVDPYFANANLPAWEIKYCLDNDKTRFAWADEGSIEAMRVYSADDESDYIYVRTPDGDNENGIAWCYVMNSEGLDFSDIADWNNYADDDVIYTEAETVAVGDFLDMSGTEVEVLALKYGNGGKGVIYYMKDEWDNECPYDFKNIQFKRYKVTEVENEALQSLVYDEGSGQYCYYGTENPIDGATIDLDDLLWCYTFMGYPMNADTGERGEWQDGSLESPYGHQSDEKATTFVSNIIKPYIVLYDEENEDHTKCGVQNLNNIVLYGYWHTIGTSTEEWPYYYAYCCSNNKFGSNCSSLTLNYCCSNTFDNYCYANTFGNDCSNNTFGNSCTNNTFSNYCKYNTFGGNCSYNTFGDSCCFNTFGYNCYSNTFGYSCCFNTVRNACYDNTFGYNCYANTFGYECDSNTIGDSCDSNTFGNGCGHNILSEYARYNIFENGVQYVALTSTTQGNLSNCLQNITVSQGVKGTVFYPKTINATRNLAYKTTYVAKGSVTTEV